MDYVKTDNEPVSLGDDNSKMNYIFNLLEKTSTKVVSLKRLGNINAATPDRPRPLLASLESVHERNSILSIARNLKNGPEHVKKIYLKKDVHPSIRKEYNRLKIAEKEIRENPENQGRTVSYDKESRSISVDGTVVETFNPHLF